MGYGKDNWLNTSKIKSVIVFRDEGEIVVVRNEMKRHTYGFGGDYIMNHNMNHTLIKP